MEPNKIKIMAANIKRVGVTRIRIADVSKTKQAMTKDDVRSLISSGAIELRPVVGVSRLRGRKIAAQKKKGLRKGLGKRKGRQKARTRPKDIWMRRVRALRIKLNKVKPKLTDGSYRRLYMMIKGGYFRDKGHMMNYIDEKKMLKG